MGPARILVAVDDEHARGLLVTVLRAEGYTVDGARDRAEAARLIDRNAYALVLGAPSMPGLGGPELARLLEDRRPAEMPALVFLAWPAFVPNSARFLMEYAARLLPWPTTPATISRIVARALVPAPA
ncbi:MAG TPA: response regulator [Methylomirabilota bacterium]|jgi:CheY-like chemotaxis protein